MARKPPKPGERKKKRVVRLTPKQVKLVLALTKGKSITDAALEAGYTQNYPGQAGSQALDAIRKSAPELLAKHGLTDDVLIEEHLNPMLNARETKFFPYTKRGKRELLTRSVVAWGPRGIAFDAAMKIRGMYVKEQENQGPQFSVVIINAANRPPWSQMRRANTPPEPAAPGV